MTLIECFKGAWRDAGRALLKMPILFLVVLAAVLVFAYASDQAHLHALIAAAAMQPVHPWRSSSLTLLVIPFHLVLTVRVIRYALLGEAAGRGIAGLGRFLLLYLMIFVGSALLSGLASGLLALLVVLLVFVLKWLGLQLAISKVMIFNVVGLICVFMMLLMAFITGRLSLLFPHAAVGGTFQWRRAWQDTRGHFWAIFGTYFMTILPVMVFSLIFGLTRLYLIRHLDNLRGWYDLVAGLSAIASLVSATIAASSAAWIYKHYARQLQFAAA